MSIKFILETLTMERSNVNEFKYVLFLFLFLNSDNTAKIVKKRIAYSRANRAMK